MSQLQANSFTSYDLSDREQLQSTIFTSLQLQGLHNLLSSYAEEKIALDYNPEYPIIFMQQEAGLKSKIEVLNYIIELSNVSQSILDTSNTPQEA